MNRLAKHGTPEAKKALLAFVRELRTPVDYEMAASAFSAFGKDTAHQLLQIYEESKGEDHLMAGMICAQAISDFSMYDDWSLNAAINIYFDNLGADYDIATIAADALDARPQATKRLLEERIRRATDEQEKARLQEFLKGPEKRAAPGNAAGTESE